jgi:hypothetical protein
MRRDLQAVEDQEVRDRPQPRHEQTPVGDPLGPIDLERCRIGLADGLS